MRRTITFSLLAFLMTTVIALGFSAEGFAEGKSYELKEPEAASQQLTDRDQEPQVPTAGGPSSTLSSGDNNPILLQGEMLQGRFLVPMRDIFEALGAKVEWDGQTNTVTGVKDNISVKLVINNNKAYVNDKTITLDVAPLIIRGKTYVPTRFVSESLGAGVAWDGERKVATITQASKKILVYELSVKEFTLDCEDPIYISVGERKSISATIIGENLSFDEKHPRWGTSNMAIADVSGTTISGYTETTAGVTERFIVTPDQTVNIIGKKPGQVILTATVGPYPSVHQPNEINRSQVRKINVIVTE